MFGRYFGPRYFGRRYFGGGGEAGPPEALVPDPLLTLINRRRRLRRLRNIDDRRRKLVLR